MAVETISLLSKLERTSLLARKTPQDARTFWKTSLSNLDSIPIKGLAVDAANTSSHVRTSYVSNNEDQTKIQNFAKSLNGASRGLALAAWALTLSAHTDPGPRSVAFAVSNSSVGLTNAKYLLRISYSENSNLQSWVYDVAAIENLFSDHAFIGYEKLSAYAPGFSPQTMIEFVAGVESPRDQSQPPITVSVDTSSWDIAAYHDSSISPGKIRILLDHFQSAMLYISATPSASISDLDLVSPAERALQLKFGEASSLPKQGLIHELVERQVYLTPDAPAVQFEGEVPVTYQELNERANAVARQLVCGRGHYVPVCIPRSVNMIIAVLAILKTGAAYVLLSEAMPLKRNLFIIDDIQAPFAITDSSTRGQFPKEVVVEDLIASVETYSKTNLNVYQPPSDVSYIIYTSGTTGTPKGVLVEHQAAYTGLCGLPEQKNLRQLLCHSPVFSAAQRSIFGTLKRGGTLCLASKENLTVHIQDTIKRMQISSLEVTPSMASLIDPSTVSSHLRRINLGGESINPALVEKWNDRVEFVNAYGLSENTQMNWRHVVKTDGNTRIIGRPTDTTLSYVLVPGTTRLSPILIPGELCLGGHQLAREYLNRSEKTRQAFLNNPFGPGKIYRTGDCVICHEDGSIEMVGRIDQQTKIDGQRVEPGESNSAIQAHPNVLDACTVAASVLNRKALVAVVVPREGIDWSALCLDLRTSLRSQLPAYAVPSYWVARQELPRNINGKTDIASLTKVIESLDEHDLLSLPRSQHTSVSNDTEHAVVEAVAGRLSVPPTSVDVEASFQDLGGSSLDAIHVGSELRHTGISTTAGSILQADSLREVAADSTAIKSEILTSPPEFSLAPANFKRGSAEDAYPATPLQEGVVADSLLGKANHVYRRVYSIHGVSSLQLRSAFRSIIKKSPLLRTSFVPNKKSFIQVVNKSVDLPWTEANKDLESFLQSPAKDPISVFGPLLRCTVLNGNTLIVDVHHSLFDYWSNHFIFNDVNSILLGQEPVRRTPFSNYVRFQLEQHNERTCAFWEDYLRGTNPSELKLKGASKTDSETDHGAFTVTSKVEADLAGSSLTHGITAGSLVHAVWALVLSICHKADDVQFAVAFSGRDADIDGILDLDGPTLCVVPMRIKLDRSLSVLDFVQQVQEHQLWRLPEYAHYGMRNALQAGNLAADSFNTMVNVLVKSLETPPNQPLVPVPQDAYNYTQYITLELDESKPGCAKLLVPFAADIKAAQSLVDTFARVLEKAVENPEVLLGQVSEEFQPILDEDQSVVDIQHSKAASPLQTLAHSSFENFAAANPSKVALKAKNGEVLSYGDLDKRANTFAAWLLYKGIGVGELIPLYMEKSIWTLVAIFGIMKAGAAFTPLDPGNPHDRNAFIVKDVEAKLIITDPKNFEACAAFGVESVVVQTLDLSSHGEIAPQVSQTTPDSVIYIIYTSGSTGMPKGVLVQHSAVVAATEGMIEATGTDSSWVSLWVLNYVFDASYYDVFTVLSAGGTLCLAPQDELMSDLTGAIKNLEITQVMLTPTITKLISGGSNSVPGLKVLNVCGERIDKNILEWAKSVDVYNGYGPTEATILMTVSKVLHDGNLNSIGFPTKHVNASIYYTDRVEPTPHGTIGELCVSGPQLAKGYLKRPEQTAAAFILNEQGELLYRTGDLARWHEDGYLECLGRKDYQVKLNGHRIEESIQSLPLGEIENAIVSTEEVDGCVVSVAEVQNKRQLVAFCIFSGENEFPHEAVLLPPSGISSVPQLSKKLTTLSQYMVPAVWLPFSGFPTLPSGKTDRKKLVRIAEEMDKSELSTYLQHDSSSEDFRPVETKEEEVMLETWANVLDEPRESIGATTSFASLGGDSISAINVVAETRTQGWSITVSDVLSNQTLAEQAGHLTAAEEEEPVQNIVYDIPGSVHDELARLGINPNEDVEDIFPCGPGQIEFLTQGHNTAKQYWQLTVCRPVAPDFDLDLWVNTTNELTSRNQILRTMYLKSDSSKPLSWMQVVLRTPPLDWAEIPYTSEEEKLKLMDELRDSFFDAAKPAVKYRLLKSSVDGSRTICIKLDHASYDGTLLRIFDDQFSAIARGKLDLEPPTGFKTFIDWNQRSDRKRALSYWTELLADYKPSNALPLQRTQNGGLKFTPINADVNSLAIKSGVTASTIFQAAYSVLVGRLSGTHDVLVDNLLTGRNAQVPDPQLLNGTCANFLPFRSQLNPTGPVKTLLQETQSLFWDTTEHGTVGLGDIYEALGKNRDDYSARMLYCFQPFEPASGPQDQMHWIVMAMSKVMMNINYLIMFEVQKTLTGYKAKMQYDADALDKSQAEAVLDLYDQILDSMVAVPESTVGELFSPLSSVDRLWEEKSQ